MKNTFSILKKRPHIEEDALASLIGRIVPICTNGVISQHLVVKAEASVWLAGYCITVLPSYKTFTISYMGARDITSDNPYKYKIKPGTNILIKISHRI